MNPLTVEIRDRVIGECQPMMIIAEIACAHEGHFDQLIRLIDLACATGADAIKFQVFDMNSHMTPQHRNYEQGKRLEFSAQEWVQAIAYTRSKTKAILCTDVYDMGSVQTVKHLNVDMLKIHSADLNNVPLIMEVAKFQKPVMIGIGASTPEEIDDCLKTFRKVNSESFVGLMHGYQGFPTELKELNILQIPTLRQQFGVPVGFLDHTEGGTEESLYISLLARAVGAFAVERHIVLDRSLKGIDHESALSLDEFKQFVQWVRHSEIALGVSAFKSLTPGEIRYRELMKKSMVAKRTILAGERISEDMVTFKRSTMGLSGEHLARVIGKKAKSVIQIDQNISEENLINE